MQWETISMERKDHIAVLNLSQPESLNALSVKMAEEFKEAINQLQSDQEARVLLISGQGHSFCSGGDFKSTFKMYDEPPAQAQQTVYNFYKSFLSLRDLSIPTIAVIKGYTIGAGLCLAMACDMRIASTDARLSMSFIKLGLNPGMGGTYFLPRLTGTAKALEVCLTGEPINAQEARQIGLVNHVVDAEQLSEFSLNLAARIANNPPIAAKLIKKAIYQGMQKELEEVLTFESLAQVTCASTKDMQEGIAAIKEKRIPMFKGC